MNRIHIVLIDRHGNETYHHGIAVAPLEITDRNVALQTVRQVFNDTIDTIGDEWNYADVLENLKKSGFDIIDPLIWVE